MASKNITINDFYKDIPGSLSENKKTWDFPTVVFRDSKNKERSNIIQIRIENEQDNPIVIKNEYFNSSFQFPTGYKAIIKYTNFSSGSKTTSSENTIIKGKNIGKKNQTNLFTQALRDALSNYMIKQNKKMQNSRYLPMLVSKQKNIKIDSDNQYYLQPKLDGIRAISYLDGNNIIMYSRKGKDIALQEHIKEELAELFKIDPNVYIDGELYLHGRPLQVISGLARKRLKKGITKPEFMLEYHVFDLFNPKHENLPYKIRHDFLHDLFNSINVNLRYIKLVPSVLIKSEKEMREVYNNYIRSGYEGIILRKPEGKYTYSTANYHSRDIIKVKKQESEEFRIVDFTEGKKGKDKGAIIWLCATKQGNIFHVVPNMTMEERYKLFNRYKNNPDLFKKEVKNKPLTVEFATWSKDGIPQQPKGIVIRDYE